MGNTVAKTATPPGNSSCNGADGDDWRRLWKNAESWSDLLNANRAFLRGEMSQSPYYRGQIDEETKPLVESLLKLHDYGILTYSSQPAQDDKEPHYADCPCCDNSEYRQRKQRAFLSFLFPLAQLDPETSKTFIEELRTDERIHTSILWYNEFCRDGCCRLGASVLGNFPQDRATHMSREAPTYKGAVESDFKSRQFIDPSCSKILDAFMAINCEVTNDFYPFIFHILAADWEPCDLAQHVAAAAERAGLSAALLESAEDGMEEEDESSSEKEAEESGKET